MIKSAVLVQQDKHIKWPRWFMRFFFILFENWFLDLIVWCLAVRNIIELKIESDVAGLFFVCISDSTHALEKKKYTHNIQSITMTPIYWMTFNFSAVHIFFQFNKFNLEKRWAYKRILVVKRRVGIHRHWFYTMCQRENSQSYEWWYYAFVTV